MNTIGTERLILALYEEKDRAPFIALLSDENVMRYVDKGVMSPEAAGTLWDRLRRMYGEGVDSIWAVFLKEDGSYVGNASVRPRPEKKEDWEISYYLIEAAWGKGFGTELAKRLVAYGFDALGLPAVFATVDYENAPSRKILKKAGMSFYEELVDEQGAFCLYRVGKP
jgi:RimJ/RimL family protein N-acetyltransferase